jgi:hypothetical protein
MTVMKKAIFFLIIFSFSLSVTGFSQKARVGLSGGVTISNMNNTISGKEQTGEGLTGFMASMIIETPLFSHLSFQPHLAYVRKGMRVKTQPFTSADTSIQLRYVDVPLNFIYTTGKKMTFYVGGGPCLSFNLPSLRVVEVGGAKSNTEIAFGEDAKSDFKGFDYGANILVGLRLLKGYFISVNYTQGIRNIIPVEKGDDKIHNNYLGIQLGYLFNNTAK